MHWPDVNPSQTHRIAKDTWFTKLAGSLTRQSDAQKHIYFDTQDEDFVVVKSDAKFNVTKNGDAYGLRPLF